MHSTLLPNKDKAFQFSLPIKGSMNGVSDNGKPVARPGRKATGLSEIAGLPKKRLPFHITIARSPACSKAGSRRLEGDSRGTNAYSNRG